MMTYVLLLVGFVLLIKGADFFVEGSSSVAKRFNVPSMVIGMTIVAMGTSLPECAVSITAAISGSNTMAISNVLGSNIFNMMVVCGVCAVIKPMPVQLSTLKREFPLSVLSAVLLLGMGYIGMQIGRVDGIILLVLFLIFLVWMVKTAKNTKLVTVGEVEEKDYKIIPMWKCAIFIIGGAIAIAFGGDLVVDSASEIAAAFGLSQTLIGLTIVAMGTSLPELVTSIVAARRGEVDMALGNVIGSNIFNILLVLGVASAISPVAMVQENIIDSLILVGMSLVVLAFSWSDKRIVRWEGAVMVAGYAAYMGYIIVR